jgi:hypothetical protein
MPVPKQEDNLVMDMNEYFEAESVYQDFCVHLQYCDPGKRNDAVVEVVHKYGVGKIAKSVRVLCDELDERRGHYLKLLRMAHLAERMENKSTEDRRQS